MNFLKMIVLFYCAFMVGCSGDYKMVKYARDEKFFQTFQNPEADLSQSAAKIETVKLLQSNDDYPIRLVLYNNGKFYYQVDELGTGTGHWSLEDGGLHLTSRRKIFDLNFYITAAEETGDKVIVKFFDRHGFNQYPLEFRDPHSAISNGKPLEKLREFRSSIKDI